MTSRLENSLRLASVIQCQIAEALTDADYSPKVLVLYLERPPRNRAQLESLQGRFGYSDLKEAALMEAYVL